MDAVWNALRERGGVARREELLAAGLSRHTITSALAKGTLLRPSRGIISLPEADPLLVRCLTTNSLLTCVSAARNHGLWVLHDRPEIHLFRPDGRLASVRAVIHRGTWEPVPKGSRTTSLLDTVLHALHCLPEFEALVMVESAVKKGLKLERLEAALSGARNGPGRRVLTMVDRGADSLVETLMREYLRREGFAVEPQVKVEGVGWMDNIVAKCVDVETDGKTHRERESRQNDYLRDSAALARGFATVRLSYSDVVHRREQSVRRVAAVVKARLAQGNLPVY